jgi:hypothetical protein
LLADLTIIRYFKKVSFLEGNDVTGLKVWTGSLLFCEYVKQNSHQFVNKSVLELGSGAGLLGSFSNSLFLFIDDSIVFRFILSLDMKGIYLSHFCGTPLVVTDGNDEVLQLLQQNIELNRPLPSTFVILLSSCFFFNFLLCLRLE